MRKQKGNPMKWYLKISGGEALEEAVVAEGLDREDKIASGEVYNNLASAIMSDVENLLKISGYSERAIEYYLTHLHVGNIKNPDAHAIYTGPCGDTMEIFLKISGVITDAKFLAIGCAGSFASGSALCEIIKGKTPEECKKLNENNLLDHLGALPEQKVHCARLTVLTLKMALDQYTINW